MNVFKKLFFVIAILMGCITGYAQGINFQGVARSANGTIIASSNISLRLSIITNNIDATPEYIETKTVFTNPQGIFSVVVGDGSNATVIGNFKNISWGLGVKFLKVEMDPAAGTNFINMGATKLQYVPYSFYSLGVDGANVQGIVPVKAGGTGVNNLNDLKKLFTPVGNTDSTGNVKIGNNVLAKSEIVPSMFFGNMHKNNINIGIGDSALYSNTIGGYNIAIGNKSLAFNKDGGFNTAIGYGAMLDLGTDTSGYQGWANTAIGSTTLMKNKYGVGNIAVGSGALELGTKGDFNTGYGMDALHYTNGSFNTGIGDSALSYVNVGDYNTAIGYRSGVALRTGNKNVFIGHSAGADSTFRNVNNRLVIDNSDTSKPLIYGEFDKNKLFINGSLSISERLTIGSNNNIAIGDSALYLVDSSSNNIAIGPKALIRSRNGYNSVGIGSSVLSENSGTQNNAIGIDALKMNQAGCCNNAFGAFTLTNNTTGHRNSAFGNFTLNQNTAGIMNSGFGRLALNGNKTGNYNSAFGANALQLDTSGNNNVAIGFTSGARLQRGDKNIFIGSFAGTNANFINVSNRLVIHNDSSLTPLIYGEFDNNKLVVNGALTATSFKIPGGTSAQYLRADGTVTTSVTAGVPYTGASQAVDLGAYDLKVNGISIGIGAKTITNTSNTAIGKETLKSNTSGTDNTALGFNALYSNTTGYSNTAIGVEGLKNNTTGVDNTSVGIQTLKENLTGYDNVAIGNLSQQMSNSSHNTSVGYASLQMNTSGYRNAAFAPFSLVSNTTGNNNMAFGMDAMYSNTIGSNNVAMGNGAMYSNVANSNSLAIGVRAMYYADNRTTGRETGNIAIGYESLKGSATASNNTGQFNTALGYVTLRNNTSGEGNTALGNGSLEANSTGSYNTAIGLGALAVNTLGDYNVSIGYQSLRFNTINDFNVAIGGRDALFSNITGGNNIAVGTSALYNNNSNNNTAIGHDAGYSNTTGLNNTFLGKGTDVSLNNLNNATAIGAGAIVSTSNTIQLGNTDVTQVKTSGAITAAGFKTPTGTSSQYLMADGTVSSGSGGSGLTLLGKILFVKNISGNLPSEIWTSNYDGTGQVKINITLPAGVVFGDALHVSMSPNGQKIVFNAGPPYQVGAISSVDTDIYTCNIDGTNVVKIIDRGNRNIYVQGVY